MEYKKIVYIAHPIAGDIENNITRVIEIVQSIHHNPKYADVCPTAPYIADVFALNDEVPAEREKGINNNLYLLSKCATEVWLYGHTITAGMQQEVLTAFAHRIPVAAKEKHLLPLLEKMRTDYLLQISNKG